MGHMELPLVFFTVLAQASIGLVLVSVLRNQADVVWLDSSAKSESLFAVVLLNVGLMASMFHLGHPLGAVYTLSNLQYSWLSREILIFGVLTGLLVATAGLRLYGKNYPSLWTLAAVVGLGAIVVQGFAYAPPSQPSLNNGVPLVLFLLTALTLGTVLSSWFAPKDHQSLLTKILVAVLFLSLTLNFLLPSVWMSGALVNELTGHAYFSSPLYWGRIVIGLIVPLVVIARTKCIPGWLVVFVLCGELAGRIAFFSLAVSTAAMIGMPL